MNSRGRDESIPLGLLPVLAATGVLPWALAGAPVWAFRPAAFLVIAGFALELARGGLRSAGISREARWLWPAAMLALLALSQSVPLPEPWVRRLSPAVAERWAESAASPTGPGGSEALARLEERALAAVPEAADVPVPGPVDFPFIAPSPGEPVRPTISYHPAATLERLAWFLALLAAFLIARKAAATPTGRAWVRVAVLGTGVLLAAVAFALRFFFPGRLYGGIKLLRGGETYGPYLNPSHFALVMELAVPWLLALAWQGYRTSRDSGSLRVVLPGASAVGCVVAAFGSGSKGGVLLVTLSVAALGVAAAAGARRKGRTAGVTVVAAAILLAVFLATPARVRVQDFLASGGMDLGSSDRILIWRHAAGLVGTHPVFGTGFGAFRHVIPRVLPAGEAEPWYQLHNDVLEVVVAGGIAGAVLLSLLTWNFWTRAVAGARLAGDDRTERLGILTGIAVASLHALFDFGHQMPANALLFVVTAAMLVPRTDRDPGTVARGGLVRWVVACILTAACGALAVRGVVAGLDYSEGTRAASRGSFQEAARALDRGGVGITRFDALWLNGDVRMGIWDRMPASEASAESGAGALNEAATRFLRAEREVAASGWTLQGLGSTYRRVERAEAAMRPFDLSWVAESPWWAVGRSGRIAVGLHRLAVEREPTVSDHRDALVVSLLQLGLRSEAKYALRDAARLQPILVQHRSLGGENLDDEMVAAFHEGAVEALGKVPMTRPQRHLLALGQTAYRLGRYDEAEGWLRRALDEPADRISRAESRAWLAFTAERQGRPEQAREWYETVRDIPNFRESSLSGLARLARDRGDVEEEFSLRDQLRREYPDATVYLLEFAESAVRAGRAGLAAEALRAAASRRPGDADLSVRLVETLLAAGDRGGARRELERAEVRFPEDPRLAVLRSSLEAGGP